VQSVNITTEVVSLNPVHDITEILLKVVLNTIKQTYYIKVSIF